MYRNHGPWKEAFQTSLAMINLYFSLFYIWTPTHTCNRNKKLPELPLTTCTAFYFGFYVSLKNAG